MLGRDWERGELTRLLGDLRGGHSRALVLRGEAGTGKTALLDWLAEQSAGIRVLRAAGVESESELAYSALQQLCAPLLDDLGRLPAPQRAALGTALGLDAGDVPQPLLVGLAVLGLLAEAAGSQPLLCVVDDVQWIDTMSAAMLGFVARRLEAESVGLVLAARDDRILAGLPELRIGGLGDADARRLLDSVLTGPVDPLVRERIVTETRGNPLALLELPRGLSPAELAFGFGGHSAVPLESRVEEGYRRRIAALPATTRTVLLAAAVEPVGDVPLLWRALDRLGAGPADAEPAESERLIEFKARVRFPHPLVRSAAWRSGTAAELRAVHAALAAATDPGTDPDRRAWHRAHAALGPDEEVAAELRNSAERARARGGWSAVAAFLERAAQLTLDPAGRGELLVEAAAAHAEAGAFHLVPELLGAAEMSPPDALRHARVERLRAQVTYVLTPGRASVEPLLAAARRLAGPDPAAARDTLLLAIDAAEHAGRFGGDSLRVVAETARDLHHGGDTFPDLLLTGLIAWALDGRAAASPILHRALDAMDAAEDIGLAWHGAAVANELFRFDLTFRLGERALRFARAEGSLALLPAAMALQAGSLLYAGRLTEAAELMDEMDAVTRATGAGGFELYRVVLGAYRESGRETREMIAAKIREAADRGDGRVFSAASMALAMMQNALGEYREAMASALEMSRHDEFSLCQYGLRELVEAATLAGEPAIAADARDRLAAITGASPAPAALGTQAVADALAGPPERAEERYRTAIAHLSAPETAVGGLRARLLYGEWLRRANRRADARAELHAAHEAFTAMGAEAFAERAGRELAATGETVRGRRGGATQDLTPQETAIMRLAAAGRTDPEIATALFLSPRTVEWHMRKILQKQGVSSRRDLYPGG